MCGIIGVASTEGMRNRGIRRNYMRMGLDIDSWRGWESTGMALVEDKRSASPIIYKRALNGRDFIQLNKVDKYLDDIEKYPIVIGHNRAATTGRGHIVDDNAHPFQYGKITLVHNGHIRNTLDLPGAVELAQCPVDSAHVAASMEVNGEMETLESLDGGFAFVWWNSVTGTLNMARNTERPLNFVFSDKENTLFFASEFTQLLHLLKEVPLDEETGLLYPEPWVWYQFDLKNLREYTKTPFVRRHGRRNTGSKGTIQRGSGAQDTLLADILVEEDEEAWEAWAQEQSGRRATGDRTGVPTFERSELDEIREDISKQRHKDARQSGIPTSRKRIERAKQELKNMGLSYGHMRVCHPVSWTKYKNQTNLGTVLARTHNGGHMVEVLQVRSEEYSEFSKWGRILVDLVNVRRSSNGSKHIVGVVSQRMKEYLKRKEENLPVSISREASGAIDRNYDGPGGGKITLDRFIELTSDGCGNCCCDLPPSQHGTLIWVGDSPLCSECGRDPGVLELVGFPRQALN